jgi:transcriptional regulator with XRE-family HTH domain
MAEERQMRPSDVFGARLRETRKSRGLSQEALAQAMTSAGRPINKVAITRIERGERGLSLDEAFALALILRVAPAHMFSPDEGEVVWLTGNQGVDGSGLRNWLMFGDPLLLSPEGRRARARIGFVFGIEELAEALVDAKRGGDQAGVETAAKAIKDRIEAHQEAIDEEES